MQFSKKLKIKNSKLKIPAEDGQGFSIVEMIVVIAIVLVAFVGILQLTVLEQQTQTLSKENSSALLVAEETLNAVRDARDRDWSNISSLTTGDNHHPATSTTATSTIWTLDNTGKETVDIYDRWFVVEDVCRDSDDDIATCPASYTDSDTLKVTSFVSWSGAGGTDKQVKLETYLTNWQSHLQ